MDATKSEESSGTEKGKRRKYKPSGFEEWGGYMAAKKAKLTAQFEEQKAMQQNSETESCIFSGVAIFVNGYTRPPADELKRLMSVHGGKYHHYYSSSKTTHVIASNLPHGKMKNLKTQIVLTADWITDSIKAGRLLSHQSYLLYTPEQVEKQQRIRFGKTIETKPETLTSNEPANLTSKSSSNISDISTLSSDCNQESYETLTVDTSLRNSGAPLQSSTSPHKSSAAITARHPEFLSEFYNHSRLHHISTAGQELKRYVQHLAENNKERIFPSRGKLKNLAQENLPLIEPIESFHDNDQRRNAKSQNIIMHLDMDCFFVSVGLKKHPELKGFPVAVTHAKGNRGGPQKGSDIHYEAAHYTNESHKKIGGLTSGNETPDNSNERPKISINSKEYGSLSEIASCSYEARKAGLRNGMFLGEALRRCPNLKTIPYDFEGYSEVSKQLYNIVASYTLDIEAVSCDELYIDCNELLHDTKVTPEQFASVLRSEIEETTVCTASAGIGSNMLLARLANKVAKPNGQHCILTCDAENFMKKQTIRDLPGVGYTTSKKLEQLGAVTCSDLQAWPLQKLQKEFGPKTGHSLFNRCRGNDDRKVQSQKDRKSVSAEINYGIRFETGEDVYKFINELSIEVQNRLKNINAKGKSLTLKLMVRKSDAPVETAKFMGHGVCDHISKSVTLRSATDCSKVIGNECCMIARSLKIKPQDYRGETANRWCIKSNKITCKINEKLLPLLKFPSNPIVYKPEQAISTRRIPFEWTIACVQHQIIIVKKVGIQLSKLESIQKEEKVHKTMKNFLCQDTEKTSSITETKKDTVSPNKLVTEKPLPNKLVTEKPLPNKNTIEHFLSNKPPLQKKQNSFADYAYGEPSQSFLDALPDDLRNEVLKSCRKAPPINQIDSPVPCCSKTLFPPVKQNQFVETSQIPSELDQSVLNALPEELRREILESYGTSVEARKAATSCGLPEPANCKENDEQLHQSVLNALPEELKKEVLESYGTSVGVDDSSSSSCGSPEATNSAENDEQPIKKLEGYLILDARSGKIKINAQSSLSTKPAKKETANLGGAFELDDIRSLLKEWVTSTKEPYDDDVNDLNNFLMEAIAEESIFKVELVLKYLYRLTKSTTDTWKRIYLTVLSNAQKKMCELYNSKLAAYEEFHL